MKGRGLLLWWLWVAIALAVGFSYCSNGNIFEEASEKTDPYRWEDSAKTLAYEADLAYAEGNRAEACRLYAKAVAKDKTYGPAVSGDVSCALKDWIEVNAPTAEGFAEYVLGQVSPTYCHIGVGCTEDPESDKAKRAGFTQANWDVNLTNQNNIIGNTSLQTVAGEAMAALMQVDDAGEEVVELRALLRSVLLVQLFKSLSFNLNSALGDYYSFLEMAAMELRAGGRQFREDAAYIREFNSMLQSQPSFLHQYIAISDPSLEMIRQDPTNGGAGWDVTVDWSRLEAELGDLQNRFMRLLMVKMLYGVTFPGCAVYDGCLDNIKTPVADLVTVLRPFYRDSRADNKGAIKYIYRALRDLYLDLAALQDEAAQGSYYVGEFDALNDDPGGPAVGIETAMDNAFVSNLNSTIEGYLNAQEGISGVVVTSVNPTGPSLDITNCGTGGTGTGNNETGTDHYHSAYPAEPCTGPGAGTF